MLTENQLYKLTEAKYFHNEMENLQKENDTEKFKYVLSAFTSAARSVLQYAYAEVENTSKVGVYQKLIENISVLKDFKVIRDLNIHTEPLKTIAKANSDIHGEIVVSEKDGEEPKDKSERTIDIPLNYFVSYHFESGENVIDKSGKYLIELEKFITEFEKKMLELS